MLASDEMTIGQAVGVESFAAVFDKSRGGWRASVRGRGVRVTSEHPVVRIAIAQAVVAFVRQVDAGAQP